MHWLNTIIYGVVEGITEFLPISSTGHLLVAEHLLRDPRSEFFLVGIQAGAVLAIVLVYWRRLLDLTLRLTRRDNLDYTLKLAVAFGVTVTLALTARQLGVSLPGNLAPIAWATLIGAPVIFLAEHALARRPRRDTVSWPVAIVSGLAQVVAALCPGASRSGATIIAGMLCGASRSAATEFSFLLGIPTMFAATGYELRALLKQPGAGADGELGHFALGFAIATVSAFLAVKWLLGYVRAHSFRPFAWYRLALGLALLWWIYTR
ncbi:MAG: undecaprenyl-diphosphate phosphatase [Verrucomicrobiales bacterium]|nr:undecaprenyl-diphosphate phosphatase [Verrucomicrobiales bacterium]